MFSVFFVVDGFATGALAFTGGFATVLLADLAAAFVGALGVADFLDPAVGDSVLVDFADFKFLVLDFSATGFDGFAGLAFAFGAVALAVALAVDFVMGLVVALAGVPLFAAFFGEAALGAAALLGDFLGVFLGFGMAVTG